MRIEIDIRDGIAPEIALECVAMVVREGRVSNDGKSYCMLSTFRYGDERMAVITRNYRKNDCFLVTKDE